MTRTPTFTFNIDGQSRTLLRELMLYVAQHCATDPTFGAVKLNKILWWSDFLAYVKFGTPITGVAYQRLQNGPAPRMFVPVRDELIEDGSAVISPESSIPGFTRNRLVPLRAPDLSLFTADKIALVNSVIEFIWNETAATVSWLSHGKAWTVAENGEDIPYEAVFLSDDAVTEEDVKRTHELAQEYGWA